MKMTKIIVFVGCQVGVFMGLKNNYPVGFINNK